MVEVTVSTNDELLQALKASKKGSVVIRFAVPELDFHNEADLELDDKCKGVMIVGPVTLRGTRFILDGVREVVSMVAVRCRGTIENLKAGDDEDMLYARKCSHIILEGCSFSGSIDEVLSFDYCDTVSIDRCIVGPPFHRPTVNNDGVTPIHPEGIDASHGYGIRSSSCGLINITNTIFTDCSRRSPQCNSKYVKKGQMYSMTVNNCVIYNYGQHGFTYNNNGEAKGASVTCDISYNTYLPGPRTCKIQGSKYEALELDCEDTDKMEFSVSGIKTNRVAWYDYMLVRYGGKTRYVGNGIGSTLSLSSCGATPHDSIDTTVISTINNALQTPHVYDNLDPDNYRTGWANSGWQNT